MFVDVRSFTGLSERLAPTQVVSLLNSFYSLAAQVIFDLGGTLDKMVGDQVMAFFGAPFRPNDHRQRAVNAALRIIAGVEDMAQKVEHLEVEHLHVGGGVTTGEAFMGNVAAGEVRDFTIIGDVVNTAARLQGAAQAGEVLVSEETYRGVAERFPSAAARMLELKGKAVPVTAYVLRAAQEAHVEH